MEKGIGTMFLPPIRGAKIAKPIDTLTISDKALTVFAKILSMQGKTLLGGGA
ncbi:MAG: hypothetical protein QNJ26_20600 [Desulfobacterales bacterium]|nr:hypothetical protein [Desulfobacterales bacterium]